MLGQVQRQIEEGVQYAQTRIGAAAQSLLEKLAKKSDSIGEVALLAGVCVLAFDLGVNLATYLDKIEGGNQPKQPIDEILRGVRRESLPNLINIRGDKSSPSSANYNIEGVSYTVSVQPKPIFGIEQPELSERELAGIALGISKLFVKAKQNNQSVSLKKEDGVTVIINPPHQGCRSLTLEFTLAGNNWRGFKLGTQILCSPESLDAVGRS